ncbi:DUF2515 family protein [Bacillus salitolerans]|uniref:DUF2515 family protein n=1 Tax=Bacillus salitolerans TaxID=1437434 RepID=A0ABW4LSN4_9BACI
MCIKNILSQRQKLKKVSTITNHDFSILQKQLTSELSKPNTLSISLGDEIKVVQRIRSKTTTLNQNNITRTKAYLDFFKEHPEVHWALLAHMVSRNGGWNMTDLKGSLIGPLLSNELVNLYFECLERANALIFNDAYPQLLLYAESKITGTNLFHLLPNLSVSKFMEPIWNYFLKTNNSHLLTVALIINEQQYIQGRVIDHPKYREEVFNSILFKAQEKLGFTEVFFPYKQKKRIELAGLTIQHFQDVYSRITIGKRLYGILFQQIHKQALSFATKHPHTGSREDFWPTIFSSSEVSEASKRIYSPFLVKAWKDYPHQFTDNYDWFNDYQTIQLLTDFEIPTIFRITSDYKSDIQKLQYINDLSSIIN